jgi:hypothetical protein
MHGGCSHHEQKYWRHTHHPLKMIAVAITHYITEEGGKKQSKIFFAKKVKRANIYSEQDF